MSIDWAKRARWNQTIIALILFLLFAGYAAIIISCRLNILESLGLALLFLPFVVGMVVWSIFLSIWS